MLASKRDGGWGSRSLSSVSFFLRCKHTASAVDCQTTGRDRGVDETHLYVGQVRLAMGNKRPTWTEGGEGELVQVRKGVGLREISSRRGR